MPLVEHGMSAERRSRPPHSTRIHPASSRDLVANPLAGAIQYVYTACQSQPCRTLHDYVWLGFNEDESGKKVIQFSGTVDLTSEASTPVPEL